MMVAKDFSFMIIEIAREEGKKKKKKKKKKHHMHYKQRNCLAVSTDSLCSCTWKED